MQKIVGWLNRLQQNQPVLGRPIAVIKKFSDDDGGHLAALMTYYGFLSLFPLLIIATAVSQIIAQDSTELRDQLIHSVTSYFPTIGDNLAASLQTPARTGIAVVIGLAVAFYGARGIANSVQNALHIVWGVPRHKRAGFPKSLLRSLGIIVFAGLGLMLSAILSGYATNSTLPFIIKITLGTAGFIMLFAVFWGIFTFGSSARKRPIANIPGAIIAALGMQLLQAIGSYIVANQLNRLTGLYAQFGTVLALLFWIYLQAQVFVFALVYNTVSAHKLYPRSIDDKDLTEADRKAHKLYAERDSYAETVVQKDKKKA